MSRRSRRGIELWRLNVSRPVQYHLGLFPPTNLDWRRLVPLIGKANAALARYDGLISSIANPSVLLSPLTTQEAVLSSRIEGTVVTMGEVLQFEAGAGAALTQSKRDDVEEIGNYRTALRFAANALIERPASPSLFREAHALLMRGARGRDKSPGAFRTEQNWIGSAGCNIDKASFVPIPQTQLLSGIEEWSRYFVDDNQPDPLVQLAVAHAEFEALHPFKDGNGRLGRMIIPLFLYGRKLLGSPSFYMSAYLETHREQYIEALRAVSRDGAWTEWCEFFLLGMIDQSAQHQDKAKSIINLNRRMLAVVAKAMHSEHAHSAVEFLFANPIFASSHFVRASQIPRPTALRFLRVLRDEGILSTVLDGSGPRPSVFAFWELLDIAEGRVQGDRLAD
jgi:Fic family protein